MEKPAIHEKLVATGTIRIRRAIADGWRGVMKYPVPAIVGTLLYFVMVGAGGAIPFANFAVNILIVPVLTGGLVLLTLKIQKQTDPKIEALFEGFNQFGRLLGLYWLQAAIILGLFIPLALVGLVAGIVLALNGLTLHQLTESAKPGTGLLAGGIAVVVVWLVAVIYVSLGLSMAYCILLDRGFPVAKSISSSFSLTKGYRGKIFLLSVLIGLVQIPGLLALGLGLLITLPVGAIAMVSAYTQLKGELVSTGAVGNVGNPCAGPTGGATL